MAIFNSYVKLPVTSSWFAYHSNQFVTLELEHFTTLNSWAIKGDDSPKPNYDIQRNYSEGEQGSVVMKFTQTNDIPRFCSLSPKKLFCLNLGDAGLWKPKKRTEDYMVPILDRFNLDVWGSNCSVSCFVSFSRWKNHHFGCRKKPIWLIFWWWIKNHLPSGYD